MTTTYRAPRAPGFPKKFGRIILIGAVLLFLFIIILKMTVTINPGEKGIIFKRLGGGLKMDKTFSQGIHIVAPWDDMIIYDVTKQEKKEVMNALSSDGLKIDLEVSIRFYPQQDNIAYLHNTLKKDYVEKLIIPEFRSSVRKIVGRYTPEEIYSTKREAIQTEIFDETQRALGENFIELDAFLIREILLPQKVAQAIERKLEQEELSKEYKFRIETEEKEALRKEIEATGIKKFQDIVSSGISKDYLTWKGIEATENLAKSPNTKVVVIGAGDDGLPLILGD